MNLYKISQDVNNGYDTYDAAIVAAESEDAARALHPDEFRNSLESSYRADWPEDNDYDGTWLSPTRRHLIRVELIGVASDHLKPGIVLASFNAG